MPSELLAELKEKLVARLQQERKGYVQPEHVSALALIEILEFLERAPNEKADH